MNTRIWIPIALVMVLLIVAVLLAGGRRAVAPVSGTTSTSTPSESTSTPPVGGGGGIVAFKSGIRGTVMLGPTCPVVRPEDPSCADKPFQTTVHVRRVGSESVFASTNTNVAGSFEFSLPPGEYVVEAVGGKLLPRCASQTATVEPSGYVAADISCDTGIR